LGRHRGRLAGTSILAGEAGVTPALASEVRQTLKTTVTEYEYSDLDELTVERVPGVDTTSYAYDVMGNRASETKRGVAKAYTYDGADRLISAGSVSYTYDASGNRASRTAGSQLTAYAFDHEDRLIAASGPIGLSQYDYDGLGRRIRSQEGGITRRYVVDVTAKPYRTLADESGAGTLELRYVYGAGLVADLTPTDTPRYFVYDGLGSTAAVTDLAGHDVAHLGYAAFGDTAIALGLADTRMGYVGRYGVEAAAGGLTFMRDRFYDAETGLFLSTEPREGRASDMMSAMLYAYAKGNTTDLIDPDGNDSKSDSKKKKKSLLTKVNDFVTGANRFLSDLAQAPITITRSPGFRVGVFATKDLSLLNLNTGSPTIKLGSTEYVQAFLPSVGRVLVPLVIVATVLDGIDKLTSSPQDPPSQSVFEFLITSAPSVTPANRGNSNSSTTVANPNTLYSPVKSWGSDGGYLNQ
jgi:RHS repeat-associated protein